MQTQRLNITLPSELAYELRRTIPNRLRSKFIADALRDKLIKRDLKQQLRRSSEAQREIIEEIQKDFKYADAETLKNLP